MSTQWLCGAVENKINSSNTRQDMEEGLSEMERQLTNYSTNHSYSVYGPSHHGWSPEVKHWDTSEADYLRKFRNKLENAHQNGEIIVDSADVWALTDSVDEYGYGKSADLLIDLEGDGERNSVVHVCRAVSSRNSATSDPNKMTQSAILHEAGHCLGALHRNGTYEVNSGVGKNTSPMATFYTYMCLLDCDVDSCFAGENPPQSFCWGKESHNYEVYWCGGCDDWCRHSWNYADCALERMDKRTNWFDANQLTFDENWLTHDLHRSYDNPVIITKPASMKGGEPCSVRLRNVFSSRFDCKIEEWVYRTGTKKESRGHKNEDVGSLAIEQGIREWDNGTLDNTEVIEVGTTSTDESWTSVPLAGGLFNETPIVFAQEQTFDGRQPVVTRLQNISESGFEVRLQEEEYLGGHKAEDIGFVAIEPSSGTIDDVKYEAHTVGGVTNSSWTYIDFDRSYDEPVFLADIQTFHGPETCNLRRRSLSSGYVDVKIEEDQSSDLEQDHRKEQVGYFVIEGRHTEFGP